jgi:hypothetical protein
MGDDGDGPARWPPATLSTTQSGSERRETDMPLLIVAVLVGLWLLGWGAFHVGGGLIHLVLIVAVVFLLLHFLRRRQA